MQKTALHTQDLPKIRVIGKTAEQKTKTFQHMKIIKTLFFAAAAALGLASCGDSVNEYHQTTFIPISNSGIVTYADQTLDSVRVLSYDSWTLNNTADWVDVKIGNLQTNQLTVNIKPGYYEVTRLDFHMQPNTTGKARQTLVQVVTAYSKIGTVTNYLTQLPYLNISTPRATKDDKGNISFNVNFSAAKPNETASTTLKFVVYSAGATLTSDSDWLTLSKTEDFAVGTTQLVELKAQPNSTNGKRSGKITLTSSGIQTVINVTQEATKKN